MSDGCAEKIIDEPIYQLEYVALKIKVKPWKFSFSKKWQSLLFSDVLGAAPSVLKYKILGI